MALLDKRKYNLNEIYMQVCLYKQIFQNEKLRKGSSTSMVVSEKRIKVKFIRNCAYLSTNLETKKKQEDVKDL